MSRPLLVRGGRLVDPAAGIDGELDILLVGGTVAEAGPKLPVKDAEVLEAKGFSSCPASSTCTRTCASRAASTPRRSRPA